MALDIVWNDLTVKERDYIQAGMQAVSDNYIIFENHRIGGLGVRGIWAAFCQDWSLTEDMYNQFMKYFDGYISEDGVVTIGTGYTEARFMNDARLCKTFLPIVLEHIGCIDDYYSNLRYKQFEEFILGYANAPNGNHWPIGDTGVKTVAETEKISIDAAWRAGMYSEPALSSAAYFMKGRSSSMLESYVLMKKDWPDEVKPPQSKIFYDGGAWFYEDYDNASSLASVLYNAKSHGDNHAHKEVNAMYLAAYGEMLTVNSGYRAWGGGDSGYTWQYINDRAISTNTVLVDYTIGDIKSPNTENDHQSKDGAGIVNGFTTEVFDYAKGDSGTALPNGSFYRSLMMVTGQDGVPGYFVSREDVTTEDEGSTATVVHRPRSDRYEVLSENTEYTWRMNESGHDVDFSIFLVNPPSSTEIIDGLASNTSDPINLKVLLANYKSDKNKKAVSEAVYFPSDGLHSKAKLERIKAGDFYGTSIDFGNSINDYVFSGSCGTSASYFIPAEEGKSSYDRIEFDADTAIVRKNKGSLGFFFIENGTYLTANEQGMQSSKPVNVFIKDGKGKIEASVDTKLTFIFYGINGIKLNGENSECVKNKGNIVVTIPAGSYEVELLYDAEEQLKESMESVVANNIFSKIAVLSMSNSFAVINGGMTETVHPVYIGGSAYAEKTLMETIIGKTDVESVNTDGSEFIPVRAAAEGAGYDVTWLDGTIIISPYGTFSEKNDMPVIGIVQKVFNNIYSTQQPNKELNASMIYVDGREVNMFNEDLREYSVEVFEHIGVPKVTLDTDYYTYIEYPESIPGDITVTLKQNPAQVGGSKYILHISNPPSGILVTASSTPQRLNIPQNTLDCDYETRWSAQGDQWICYDFGSEKGITGIELAWYLGDTRYTPYELQYSNDNENWIEIYKGRSSGTTTELEKVPLETDKFTARYVRVYGHGNSSNTWVSLSDVKFSFADGTTSVSAMKNKGTE